MNLFPALASASWISSTTVGSPNAMAAAPYLRKTFWLEAPAKSAWLTVTALGLYECEINGHRVGDEIFAPGWTDYGKRVQVQLHDVLGHLHPGENIVGAILGDGWYCGHLGWARRQQYGERPQFLAHLEIVLETDAVVIIVSDSSWKTATGPILQADLLMGEIYDARLEFGAWSQSGFDDSRWQPVLENPPAQTIEFSPRTGPPVRRIEEIDPVSERRMEPGIRLFDLGQNFSGRVRIKARSARGKTLRLRFAEVLQPDGTIYTDNLRAAKCTDYYTFKGDETVTWEPRFTFHGFRYVEAQGLAPDDWLEVTGVVLHSDTLATGTFRCSHAGLNQLQHNIVWGQKSNFLEVPTDCPQRDERLGWTGDAQVFIRTAAFNMDVLGFFHKWMRDVRDAQRANGAIPCVVPACPAAIDLEDGGPAWADATIICPWTIYLCYADRTILADHYDAMQRFMEFIAHHRSVGPIRNHPHLKRKEEFGWDGFGDWLALDGGGKTEGITPNDLIGTAFYAYDAGLMAKIADVLDRPDDAQRYRALHAEIVEAFRHRFITPAGLVVSGTQTAYVLALHFGLVPPESRAAAAEELVRDIRKRGNHLATGFVGTPYLLDVLEDTGHIDTAYRLLEQETFPSWLFPVHHGATTIWERWDGWTPEKGFQDKGMNSFNHYAYGAVGAWMYRTVAGLDLDPAEPGYAHVIFRPRPGGSITWAEANLQTASGSAAIRWNLEADILHVELTVPPGCRATFLPPPGYRAHESKYPTGTYHLELKQVQL